MNPLIELIILSMMIAFVIMSLLWFVQRNTGNAGVVDIGWSGTIPLLAIIASLTQWPEFTTRTILALTMAIVWGGRLVWHIHQRSCGKPEDARYAELRRAWGTQAQIKLFVFFQFQAVAAVIFGIPFFIAILHLEPSLLPLEYAGFILWLLVWLGEGSADRQLARFKRDPSSKGKVCEVGWWNYSRHPNYFFEWLIWVALALFAWSSPNGAWALICPVLMLFFLFKVTGIPATEEQALKSKGDAYRLYQRTTSSFVPWFKRSV